MIALLLALHAVASDCDPASHVTAAFSYVDAYDLSVAAAELEAFDQCAASSAPLEPTVVARYHLAEGVRRWNKRSESYTHLLAIAHDLDPGVFEAQFTGLDGSIPESYLELYDKFQRAPSEVQDWSQLEADRSQKYWIRVDGIEVDDWPLRLRQGPHVVQAGRKGESVACYAERKEVGAELAQVFPLCPTVAAKELTPEEKRARRSRATLAMFGTSGLLLVGSAVSSSTFYRTEQPAKAATWKTLSQVSTVSAGAAGAAGTVFLVRTLQVR